MARVKVYWTRTESFSAVIELPEDVTGVDDYVRDNEDELLVDLEEPNAVDEEGHPTFAGTDREVESVELLIEAPL